MPPVRGRLGGQGFDIVVEDGNIVNDLVYGGECRSCCNVEEKGSEGHHFGVLFSGVEAVRWWFITGFDNGLWGREDKTERRSWPSSMKCRMRGCSSLVVRVLEPSSSLVRVSSLGLGWRRELCSWDGRFDGQR
jgi:hypothetical protein